MIEITNAGFSASLMRLKLHNCSVPVAAQKRENTVVEANVDRFG